MASKIFPVILIAVVIWLGAQIWRESAAGRPPGDTLSSLKLGDPKARPPASDFTLTSTQGATVQLSSYQGKSPVLLNFFATW
jgi:hypothetical protein